MVTFYENIKAKSEILLEYFKNKPEAEIFKYKFVLKVCRYNIILCYK